MNITEELFKLQDPEYKKFQSALMPTVNPEKIIGVRTPYLRKLGKEFAKEGESRKFIKSLPHRYYEENNIHAVLLEQMRDYDELITEINRFLPFIDNWATCDMFLPKLLKKHKGKLLCEIDKWLSSDKTYTQRFGIGLLMKLYLDEKFSPEFLQKVSEIHSEEYYVNMMIAWYFATALAKQYETSVIYLEEKRLDVWTHNKTIQKATESYRIPKETKEYLKTLKIK